MNCIDEVSDYLESRGLRLNKDVEMRLVRMSFCGKSGTHHLALHVDGEAGVAYLFGPIDIRVPEGARPMVAESVCRANYRLPFGRFDFNHGEGRVTFHASQLMDGALSGGTVERMLGEALAALDRFSPAFLSVIFGNEEPSVAIGAV